MPLVAEHQFVAILRSQGWRTPLIGTWTAEGVGEGTAPDGHRARWRAPRDSGPGEDELTGPLGPQGAIDAAGSRAQDQNASAQDAFAGGALDCLRTRP